MFGVDIWAIIFVWLFFTFACAAVTSNKGHSSGKWFLFGLFFGPISLIVIVLKAGRVRHPS